MSDNNKRNEQARNRRKKNPEKFREIGRRSYIKNRDKAAVRNSRWRAKNLDRAKEIANTWKNINPEKAKASVRQARYKITQEQFIFVLTEQNNCCAVCFQTFIKTPHVDHNHACCPSKKSCGNCFRGLLCKDCNLGLGRFKDNTQVLENAIRYLKKHKELNVTAGPTSASAS